MTRAIQRGPGVVEGVYLYHHLTGYIKEESGLKLTISDQIEYPLGAGSKRHPS